MAKSRFAFIAKGTRAVKSVTFPFAGENQTVGVRPLTGRELGDVLGAGREYAIAHGLKDPKDGDRLYELGQMAHTLALACVDVDVPESPYFTSAEEVLDGLDPDRIVLLYEEQQAWQDECAPRADKMSGTEFMAKVIEVAGWESGPDPLLLLRPTLRANFTHTLAKQFINSLTLRSSSSSISDDAAPRL